MSKKRQLLNQTCSAERERYLRTAVLCDVCGRVEPKDVHEIARGPARNKAVTERCTWLAVCRACHEDLDDYKTWTLARQLAVKLVVDPEFFDLDKFNALRGRSSRAITLVDVADYLDVREMKEVSGAAGRFPQQ